MTYSEVAEVVDGNMDIVPIPIFSAELVDETQDQLDPPDLDVFALVDGPEDAD